MAANHANSRVALELAAIVLVTAIYLYPSVRARAELGSTVLPPIFAPDLSLYLNLSHLTTITESRVLNPYYRVPVPSNGTGYLKFGLAPRVFGRVNEVLDDRTWFALLIWNVFWWGLLCVVALWVFNRFFPKTSPTIGIVGLGLVMLFNFGILKTLLLAWVHLPSLAAFNTVGLPFMRAFIPVIPSAFVLAYLGLQMEVLRRGRIIFWIAMGALQLLALAIFPYATLMMAGLTAVSLLWQIRLGVGETWHVPLVYGVACAFLDCAFLWHSSLGFYDNRSSEIHFQPQLLPHLIGGNWLLLAGLTVTTALSKKLGSEVKWPLVGLGATNALLMLGDAIVPATTILLSHHAAHFVHLTMATLITFLVATPLAAVTDKPSWVARSVLGLVLAVIFLNGVLLALGTYRGFLPTNREIVELSRLHDAWSPKDGDLVIARSQTVDDTCGWIVLLSTAPVLFCTDAEVMLTPQQNQDIHRFRQAVYLYLTGKDSDLLRRALAAPDPSSQMYRLGYWGEATSLSLEERKEGIRAIQTDLIPLLERVESHDVAVNTFFRKFRRIIVIDNQREHTFAAERLASFLKLEGQQSRDDLVVLFYAPR